MVLRINLTTDPIRNKNKMDEVLYRASSIFLLSKPILKRLGLVYFISIIVLMSCGYYRICIIHPFLKPHLFVCVHSHLVCNLASHWCDSRHFAVFHLLLSKLTIHSHQHLIRHTTLFHNENQSFFLLFI